MGEDAPRTVRLSVAADPRHVWTARLFAAATARHYGFPDDTVEDLRLAVSEAVTGAIGTAGSAAATRRIDVNAVEEAQTVTFEIAGVGESTGAADLSVAVIRSLFPKVDIVALDDGSVVRIALDRPVS